MSYTVCIVTPTLPDSDEDAWRHLNELLARRDDERALPPAPVFLKLIDRLTQRFPCISDLPKEEANALWSDGPLRSQAGPSVTVLGMVSNGVEHGLPFIIETANALSLIVFDQQTRKIHRPAMSADASDQEKLYGEGKGDEPDKALAVARFRKAAELGDADAQAKLGLAYLKGEGIARDPAWAFSWLRKAAAQNNAEAQYWLGHVAEKPAPFQAIDWYRRAAQQDHVEAQIRLTVMYSANGAPYEDQVQASAWYHNMAERGYAGAQYMLGLRHIMGQGVIQDRAQAVAWLQKAAQQGHAGAKLQLDKVLHAVDGWTGKKAHKPFWKFW